MCIRSIYDPLDILPIRSVHLNYVYEHLIKFACNGIIANFVRKSYLDPMWYSEKGIGLEETHY